MSIPSISVHNYNALQSHTKELLKLSTELMKSGNHKFQTSYRSPKFSYTYDPSTEVLTTQMSRIFIPAFNVPSMNSINTQAQLPQNVQQQINQIQSNPSTVNVTTSGSITITGNISTKMYGSHSHGTGTSMPLREYVIELVLCKDKLLSMTYITAESSMVISNSYIDRGEHRLGGVVIASAIYLSSTKLMLNGVIIDTDESPDAFIKEIDRTEYELSTLFLFELFGEYNAIHKH